MCAPDAFFPSLIVYDKNIILFDLEKNFPTKSLNNKAIAQP
jgi:hypothetical protein